VRNYLTSICGTTTTTWIILCAQENCQLPENIFMMHPSEPYDRRRQRSTVPTMITSGFDHAWP
jgi:hypothetical protein